MSEASVDKMHRLLLVTWNEELGQELRGLCFLLWRTSPSQGRVREHNVEDVFIVPRGSYEEF